jgi:hypothetical protein
MIKSGYRYSGKKEFKRSKCGRINANGENQTGVEHHTENLVVKF